MATVVSIASISNQTPKAGQPVNLLVSVQNTGAIPITVQNIQAVVSNPAVATAAAQGGLPVTVIQANQSDVRGGGAGGNSASAMVSNMTVANGTTSYFPVQVVAHQPQVPGAAALPLLVNVVVTDDTNGITQAYAAVPVPTLGTVTPSNSGGSLATATYLLKVTQIGPSGESAASAESSGQGITGPNGSISVAFTPIPGATATRIYYTTGGTGTEANYMQFAGVTSPQVLITTAGNVAAAPPAASTFANIAVNPVLAAAQ